MQHYNSNRSNLTNDQYRQCNKLANKPKFNLSSNQRKATYNNNTVFAYQNCKH